MCMGKPLARRVLFQVQQYTYTINTYRNSVNNQFAIDHWAVFVVRGCCHLRTAAMAWSQTWDIPESLDHYWILHGS